MLNVFPETMKIWKINWFKKKVVYTKVETQWFHVSLILYHSTLLDLFNLATNHFYLINQD